MPSPSWSPSALRSSLKTSVNHRWRVYKWKARKFRNYRQRQTTQWLVGKLCPSPSSFSLPPPRPDSLTGFESSVLDIPSIGTCQENFSVRVPTYNAPSWSCKWVLENLGKQELIDSLIKHNKKGFWLVYVIIEQSSGAMVKNPPAMQETQETQVQTLDGEDPLEKEMATHSSILAWKIPWTETLATVCYSLLLKPATVCGVAKNLTWLSNWACTPAREQFRAHCPMKT